MKNSFLGLLEMPTSSAMSYSYSKACGIVGKSFYGKRVSRLSSLTRLSDLDKLLFPDNPLDVPERELSSRIERRIIDRSLDSIMRVLAPWPELPPVLLRLLRAVEVAELKSALSAHAAGDRLTPPHTSLGRFGQVRWSSWPDISAMLSGTEYEWAIEAGKAPGALLERETAFDKRYYEALWRELPPSRNRNDSLRGLIAEEIALKNLSWALRLRIFYSYSTERIRPFLVSIKDGVHELDAAALCALELPLDRREAWLDWEYPELVNEESRGKSWSLDPVHVQNRCALRLAKKARQIFRQRPFSLDALAAWIRLVQFEEDLLTAVAEGLALGMGVREILDRPEAR